MASPQCCANPPTPNHDVGEGKVVESFGGLRSYLAGTAESKLAVVLISDIYGSIPRSELLFCSYPISFLCWA
jgi:carboxymethylenebutenolidase